MLWSTAATAKSARTSWQSAKLFSPLEMHPMTRGTGKSGVGKRDTTDRRGFFIFQQTGTI